MKKIFMVLLIMFSLNALAQERSPFTNINFGSFIGWGDYIKVENPYYFPDDADKELFLIEVNGLEYKEIIKKSKKKHGKDNWKCRMAEHFVETMKELGVVVGQTVDLKLYEFGWSHKTFEVKDVPVTAANLDEIQFETNFCQ